MYHLFAELERRLKAKETFEHQRHNARQRCVNGGIPPYGYRRKEVEIVDDAGTRKTELTSRLEVELLKVEARLEELVDVLADRTLPRDVVTKKLRAEQNRKEQIESEIAQHKVSIPALPPPLYPLA